jgi:hypothetical protein
MSDYDSDGDAALSMADLAFFGQGHGSFLANMNLPEVRTWENPRKRKRDTAATTADDAATEAVEDTHRSRQQRKVFLLGGVCSQLCIVS